VAARCLGRYAGKTQPEIARLLGMGTGGAVSAQVKRLPALMSDDRRLAKKIQSIEKLLDQERRLQAGNQGKR